jgi:hypothetical protein
MVTAAATQPRKELRNAIVRIQDINSQTWSEEDAVRLLLDTSLSSKKKHSTATVASTIFPVSLWNPRVSRGVFYERYMRLWPRIQAYRQNRRGTYFQRLIDYPRATEPSFNQLEKVISIYQTGTRRRSALQCSILAPHLDLNGTPYQGFPCLQQVAFLPDRAGGLEIAAFYPMQYLWERAYGNYLGLIHLGKFVAHEMDLELRSMSCVCLVAKLENLAAIEVTTDE